MTTRSRSLRGRLGRRVVSAAVVPLAVLASAGVVWQSSYAAFSDTTSNPTNTWAAGTVTLTDDDSATAMFSATGLMPGSTGSRCIAVTSTSHLPSVVRLYGTSYSTTNGLATHLALTVEEGTGGSFGSCTGFTPTATTYDASLAAFGTGTTSFATGVGRWTTTGSGSETRTYRITYTLGASTPDSAQGGTASLGFTWESQSSS